MKADILKAETKLKQGGYTLVLVCGDEVIVDTRRGVKPLLDLLDSSRELKAFSAADKVVGKAAAFIYILLGVAEIYADVISGHALEVLSEYNIPVGYGKLVPAVRNRTDTGFCPMETAVLDETQPEAALGKIRDMYNKLNVPT